MKSNRIVDSVQIVTGFAVLIGLGLIVWELQQAKTFAKTERALNGLNNNFQRNLTMMGENSSAVEIKACLTPEELTNEELAVAWATLNTQYNRIFSTFYIERIAEFATPVKSIVRPWLRKYLGSKLGKWDYENRAELDWDSQVIEIAADIVSKGEINNCVDLWERMVKAMQTSE